MTAPAGFPPLFDSHTHLVSADRDRFPLDYQGQPGHVGEALPEGDDPLLQRLIQHPPTLDKMLGWFDDFGVTGGCGVQYRTAYGTDNAYLLHSAKQSPDRIIPVVLIDPRAPETPDAVRRMAAEDGIAGVRVSGFRDPKTREYPWFDSEEAARTWAVVDELGLTAVFMYLPPQGMDEADANAALTGFSKLAKRFPNAYFELDHCGWPGLSGGERHGLRPGHDALKSCENVFFKYTSFFMEQLEEANQDIAAALRHYVDVFGAERIMWGSDVGNTPGTYTDLIELAVHAGEHLTEEERRHVFRETAMRVFVPGGRGQAGQAKAS